jgi:hypothetical protein
MKRDVVIWTGPVAFFQVPGATLPDAYEINEGCFGDRPPHCMNRVAPIPTLLGRHNVPIDNARDIVIGAFSAGGSLVKRLMVDADNRARTAAVHLADATWTAAWEDKVSRRPPYDEGFVRYALDAIDGPHMLVATASPIPNKTWATGVENLRRLREEIEARSARQFTELDHFYGIDPAPEHAYQLGNVILAEYPQDPLGHGHTTIAGQVWQKIIIPWLATARSGVPVPGPGPSPGPAPPRPAPAGAAAPSGWKQAAYFMVAAAVGYGALRTWSR